MAIDILMPALSPTMESGTVSKWTVSVGDAVRSGDVIAEIETDKATMEVEAVEEGVLAVILVSEGAEGVAVGTPIARLAEDGEAVDEVAASPAVSAPAAQPTAKAPAAEKPAAEKPADKPAPAAIPAAMPAPVSSPSVKDAESKAGGRIFASPLARRIAADRGVDLTSLAGSGPHGRILRRDVEAAETRLSSSAGAASMPANAPMSAIAGASTVETNSQMRRIIAQRLQESKANAPHFYLTVDCEIDNLLAARRWSGLLNKRDLLPCQASRGTWRCVRVRASWHLKNFPVAALPSPILACMASVNSPLLSIRHKGPFLLSVRVRNARWYGRDSWQLPR